MAWLGLVDVSGILAAGFSGKGIDSMRSFNCKIFG